MARGNKSEKAKIMKIKMIMKKFSNLKREKYTDKEMMFALYVSMGHGVRQSALKAGYAELTAKIKSWDLLKKPHMVKLVKALKSVYVEEVFTKENLVEDHQKILKTDYTKALKQKEIDIYNKAGDIIGSKKVYEIDVDELDGLLIDTLTYSEKNGGGFTLPSKAESRKFFSKYFNVGADTSADNKIIEQKKSLDSFHLAIEESKRLVEEQNKKKAKELEEE